MAYSLKNLNRYTAFIRRRYLLKYIPLAECRTIKNNRRDFFAKQPVKPFGRPLIEPEETVETLHILNFNPSINFSALL